LMSHFENGKLLPTKAAASVWTKGTSFGWTIGGTG
jgi:hypothetical protein